MRSRRGVAQVHTPSQGEMPQRRQRGLSATEQEDHALIRQVAAQDRQAFEVLYRRYARRVYGYLARLIPQHELVEEVLDDVMLVVWQNATRFDYTARLSTWIFGIAYHKALKARSRMPQSLPDTLSESDAERDIDPTTPEENVMYQELNQRLTQALRLLPPEQRAVVELTFAHDHSYQEIATILGCPVNTVKTRMFHARRRLSQLCATDPSPQL